MAMHGKTRTDAAGLSTFELQPCFWGCILWYVWPSWTWDAKWRHWIWFDSDISLSETEQAPCNASTDHKVQNPATKCDTSKTRERTIRARGCYFPSGPVSSK